MKVGQREANTSKSSMELETRLTGQNATTGCSNSYIELNFPDDSIVSRSGHVWRRKSSMRHPLLLFAAIFQKYHKSDGIRPTSNEFVSLRNS